MKKEKKEIKYEQPIKYQDKKEAPIQKQDSTKEPAKDKVDTTRYNRGIFTTHKDYNQPRPVTATYMMLDPRTMYVHSDPNLAMKNYVKIGPKVFDCYNRKAA